MNVRLRRLLWPGVMTVAMLAVLLGLGTWQVRRLHWKRGILAQIARAEAAPPVPLPADPGPYTKVQVTGRLRDDLAGSYGAEVRDTPAAARTRRAADRAAGDAPMAPPSWSIAAGCRTSAPRPLALPEGDVTVNGYVQPERYAGPVQCRRRSGGAAASTRWTRRRSAPRSGCTHVAPFVLIAMGPSPPEGCPIPRSICRGRRTTILSYAITWYGLAVALVVIFAAVLGTEGCIRDMHDRL